MKKNQPVEPKKFWNNDAYAKKHHISEKLTDALLLSIEKELGYRLPPSYIAFMKQQNGGVHVNTCFRTKTPTSWAKNHVAISCIFGIGRKLAYSLCGSLGS